MIFFLGWTFGLSEFSLLLRIVRNEMLHCFYFRGEFKEAYKILTSLNMRKINYGRSVPNAFVLGAASAGDVFRLTELIKQHQPHDQGKPKWNGSFYIYHRWSVRIYTHLCAYDRPRRANKAVANGRQNRSSGEKLGY